MCTNQFFWEKILASIKYWGKRQYSIATIFGRFINLDDSPCKYMISIILGLNNN